MKMMRSVTALVATTMLATSVTPAMAQSFPRNGYGYGDSDRFRHRHDRGVSAGDVIAGVAIIGIIAAIAGAASKSGNRNRGYNGGINAENQAADACASRIEQRYGNNVRVRGIDTVQQTNEGYYVRGTVETNDRYNQGTQRFTCSVRYGEVDDVRIDNGYAYRGY